MGFFCSFVFTLRKLKSIVRWTIWLIIGFYMAIIVVLHIPAMQKFAGNQISDVLSKKLGTEVKIGQVEIGLLNHLILNDITIYDQKQKKMLKASRIAAKFDIIELLRNGRIRISSAQIFGLHANLYKKNRNANPNFKFVLDSLASKDERSKSPLDLQIRSLIIRNSSVTYDELDAPITRRKFNPKHLDLRNISGHLNLNELTDNRISFTSEGLSFKEVSGLEVLNLAFEGVADKKQAKLRGFKLQLANSRILIPSIYFQFKHINDELDLNSLRATVSIKDSYVTPFDVASFMPQLSSFKQKVFINGKLESIGRKVKINSLNILSDNNDVRVEIRGIINDIETFNNFNLFAKRVSIKTEIIKKLSSLFHIDIPKELYNLGSIQYSGIVKKVNSEYTVNGKLNTSEGNAKLNLALKGKTFKGKVKTNYFNLGNVFSNSGVKGIVADIGISGTTDFQNISANGLIPQFDYAGYSYRNIAVRGNYSKDTFRGRASLNDINGKLNFNGTIRNFSSLIDKKGKLFIDAFVEADKLNLKRLKLSDAVGDKAFTFTSHIKGRGSSLNDLIAQLDLNNFTMLENGKVLKINYLKLNTQNSFLNKFVDINSDFGDLHLSGRYDYKTIQNSIVNILTYYLPGLFNHKSFSINGNNDFVARLNITNPEILNQLFELNLNLGQHLNIDGYVNERSKQISLNLDAPDIIYHSHHVENLLFSLSTSSNHLLAQVSGDRIDDSGRKISITSNGVVGSGKISTNSSFNIEGNHPLTGEIDCNAILHRVNGKLTSFIHFNPSEIQIDTIGLNVQSSDMVYSDNSLNIKHFEISNKDQHIIVNGLTSGSSKDSLTVQLKDIDVPYIMDIVNFHSVKFDGLASGKVIIKSFFSTPQAKAQLNVKDFHFENGLMGTLYLNSSYNDREGRIHIDAFADPGDNSRTDIKGYVDIKKGYINLPIYASNTHLYFLKEFCSSFMDDINLTANGWCKVVGPLSDINLEGDMYASGNVYITPLGTRYTLNNSRVRIIPNEIIFERDTIYDAEKNIGIVTGGLHHHSLRKLTYDINIEANNLLVYNFPKNTGGDAFWGVVYGTGKCLIVGRDDEVTMNIDMYANKNSFITYNATDNSVGENSFIQWRDLTPDTLSELRPDSIINYNARGGENRNKKDNWDIANDLRINFLINATPGFTLGVLMDESTGDNITLNGTGGLRATYYNKGAFQLFGNYNVDYGLYNLTIQNIIKRQFVFQPSSSISFGGDPFDATLSLKGIYALNSVPLSDLRMGNSFTTNNTRVDCLLNIDGTPTNPSVTFGIDLPTLSSDAEQMVRSVLNSEQGLNQQVLYLLAVGRFYPQISNNATQETTSQPGQASLAMQSILSGTLSQQINTVLANVIKNNNWNFGANIATGNEGFANAEYEGTLSGKLLNNRLLINGEFGYRDNVATNTSSFIGDFDIKYLLFPTGNLSVNFYNRSNERYFTRNSLTTQGIGLIMKKDFTTIKDLFHLNKKKSKKQKQKR